jgi:hypothetical protein
LVAIGGVGVAIIVAGAAVNSRHAALSRELNECWTTADQESDGVTLEFRGGTFLAVLGGVALLRLARLKPMAIVVIPNRATLLHKVLVHLMLSVELAGRMVRDHGV